MNIPIDDSSSTIMSSAMKRSPEECVCTSQEEERIKALGRPRKRARTEKFLKAADEFTKIQQTCSFFNDELLIGVIPASCSSSIDGHDCDINEELNSALSIFSNLRKQTLTKEKEFRIRCERSRADADDAIRLHESFHCMVKGVESKNPSKKCHLPLLDQGLETNTTIMGMIKNFAGVESEEDIADWKELRSHLPCY